MGVATVDCNLGSVEAFLTEGLQTSLEIQAVPSLTLSLDILKVKHFKISIFKFYRSSDSVSSKNPSVNFAHDAGRKDRVVIFSFPIYTAYEERNAVEYSFNTLKSKLNCNRTRVHCGDAWEGRLFREILATAISGMVRTRIKLYNEREKSPGDLRKYRLHHDSDRQLLGLLNNIYMTTFNEGWFFDDIVGKKKELFRILSVPVPTVKHEIYQPEPAEEPGYAADIETIAIETANDETEDL